MRFYLIHKKGKITETSDAGHGANFDKKGLELSHKDETVLKINEDDYNKIKDNLEFFEIKNDIIIEKTDTEKNIIEIKKVEWINNNTIEGLKNKITNIEKNLIIPKNLG